MRQFYINSNLLSNQNIQGFDDLNSNSEANEKNGYQNQGWPFIHSLDSRVIDVPFSLIFNEASGLLGLNWFIWATPDLIQANFIGSHLETFLC